MPDASQLLSDEPEMESSFDTYLLDEAIARRQHDNEQHRQAILVKLWQWLDQFGDRYGMQGVYVFGSLTTLGRFTERSDVDVAFEAIDAAAFFDVIGLLSTELEREVDLVDLGKCHFAQKIREQGILWNRED
jgi:uncharacterized protein